MKRVLVFLPDVARDFDEIWHYYEEASPQRGGDRFEAAYSELLEQIKTGFVTHRVVFAMFHRAFLRGYPYTLYYRLIDERRVVVVALLYARFDPERTKTILGART